LNTGYLIAALETEYNTLIALAVSTKRAFVETTRRQPKRIGELLIEAGIIRSEELPAGLKEAQERSLRLGEVLVMMRYVTSEDLEAVLQAQSKLNDGSISDTQAIEALRTASAHRIPFDEALTRANVGVTNAHSAESIDAQLKPLLQELEYAEQTHGPQNREIGNISLRIGDAYAKAARYAEAERHYRRALQIFERSFGQRNLKVASCLGKLGDLFFAQQKYADAETIYWRVLDITQSAWGAEHNDVAQCHKALARLLEAQGRLKEAEQFYLSALRIMEKVGGPDHPELTETLRHLASFWMRQGKKPERKRLGDLLSESGMLSPDQLQEALQKSAQTNSPLGQTLVRLNYLTEEQLRPALQAQLLIGDGVIPAAIATRALRNAHNNGSLDEALRALGWDPDRFTGEELKTLIDAAEELMSAEVALGFEHAGVAVLTVKLADLYVDQKKFAEAEPLYKRALLILEKFFGPKDAEVANALVKMSKLLALQGKYIDAERGLWRALEILQLAHGQDHVEVANTLDTLAGIQEKQANPEQALRLYQSSISIKEKVLGKDNPETAASWSKLAYMQFLLDNYAESEAIYLRLIRSQQRSTDSNPDVLVNLLEKLGHVYFTQGDLPKALTQQELALEIHEEKSDNDARKAELMEKYSILLDKSGRSEESRKIMEQAQIMKRMRA
jgi:tetratricopeptide (TPR) repeat protein